MIGDESICAQGFNCPAGPHGSCCGVLTDAAQIAALTAERAALALQVQRARDDALEELVSLAQQIGFLSVEDIRALRGATEGAGG